MPGLHRIVEFHRIPYGRNLPAPWRRPQRLRSSLNVTGHQKGTNVFPSALSNFWINPKCFIQFEKKYWSYFRIVLKPTSWQLALLHHSLFLFAFPYRSLQVIGLYFAKVWKVGINANRKVSLQEYYSIRKATNKVMFYPFSYPLTQTPYLLQPEI